MNITVPATEAFVALGVMSTAATFETGRASGSKMALMRSRVREAAALVAGERHGVALRFLLASRNGKSETLASEAVRAESSTHGDLVFLNMTERFYLCAWKKIMWYRYALVHFPSAQFIMIADPDAFVQLSHLGSDLRNVHRLVASGAASQYVLYGLILWKAYYNALSEEPAAEFTGWLCQDAGALRLRRRFEYCRDVLRNATGAPPRPQWLLPGKGSDSAYDAWAEAQLHTLKPCKGLQRSTRRALDRMDASSGPYPFASGPLFGLSRPLAVRMAAPGGPADRWRKRIEATQPLRLYFARGHRIPFTLRGAACYPASFDATHGRWVWELARDLAFGLNVTLVNTPFMVQHHPWLAFHHGAFSNRSIVVHELKNPNSPGWRFAPRRGGGPFIPFERTCGPCGEPAAATQQRGPTGMGWVTESLTRRNPVAAWTCCGAKDGSCGEQVVGSGVGSSSRMGGRRRGGARAAAGGRGGGGRGSMRSRGAGAGRGGRRAARARAEALPDGSGSVV